MDIRRVFWADSERRRIESAAYDGSARRSVIGERLQKPGAVAVAGQHVFWLDDGAKTVERAYKDTGTGRVIVKMRSTQLTQFTDLIAVVRPDGRCVNACGRLACSHLCVVDVNGTARCWCPAGMSLSRDSLNCLRVLPDCAADQVRCRDGGACVPRCDGVTDCPDLTDELGCYGSCLPSQFQCLSGATRCVETAVRCDGRADCDDDSDEVRCVRCDGGTGAMLCRADGRCIGRELVCDGRRHCSDGDDERHCVPATAVSGPRHAALTVVGSMCGLLLIVLTAISVVFWRRRRTARRHKTLTSPSLAAVSKSSSVGLQAMIAAVSSTSCRGGSSYRSPLYDRVPPGSTSTSSSSGCTSISSVPACRCYPRETLNPPPSPCTSQFSASRRHPFMVTPCSTDVCDDVDSAAALSAWQIDTAVASVDYETEPLYRPPPPTPYSRRADDDCVDDGASSLGWCTATSLTRCSYENCERHQHSVTRATSPLSSVYS